VRTWQRSLHGAVVALLSDLVVRVAQLYACCASGARQRPRTVRLTHGCANSAPKPRPLPRQCQLGTSISDPVNFTPQALQQGRKGQNPVQSKCQRANAQHAQHQYVEVRLVYAR
jgi:hypothetical protein